MLKFTDQKQGFWWIMFVKFISRVPSWIKSEQWTLSDISEVRHSKVPNHTRANISDRRNQTSRCVKRLQINQPEVPNKVKSKTKIDKTVSNYNKMECNVFLNWDAFNVFFNTANSIAHAKKCNVKKFSPNVYNICDNIYRSINIKN